MLRWLSILVVALALVAAGCGGSDDASAATDETTIEETTTTDDDHRRDDDGGVNRHLGHRHDAISRHFGVGGLSEPRQGVRRAERGHRRRE